MKFQKDDFILENEARSLHCEQLAQVITKNSRYTIKGKLKIEKTCLKK